MNKYIKNILICLTISTFCITGFAETVRIDDLKGLQRNPKSDRIENGAHDIFDNVYLNYGNIQVVKGRDRLNSTAHSDVVVNGLFYYENQAGTIKKLVVAESDELVTYNIDGTNRVQIASGLTNEKWDAQQIGDNLYLTSATNGIYKWPGSGSASVLTGVSAPSSVTFTASSTVGSMTPGLDAILQVKVVNNGIPSGSSARYPTSASSCLAGPFTLDQVSDASTNDNKACSTYDSNWIKSCASASTYKYKLTSYNSTTAIESEASTSTTIDLKGADQFDNFPYDIYTEYNSSATCAANANTKYRSQNVSLDVATRQTSTSTTMLAAPSAPFNGYCIYRTVSTGTEFFKVGCITEGFSSAYADGKADVSLGTALDTTIDTINPPSFRYIEEYKGAIFVAENDTVKFTRLPVSIINGADQYWLDSDELQVTGNITGLIKAADSLLIFTSKSIYQVTGFGASSFRLTPIVSGIGAVSDETIKVDTNGDVIFFAGTEGLYKLTIGQQAVDSTGGPLVSQNNARLTRLSSPALDDVFSGEDTTLTLSPSDYTVSHAYYDSDNNLYFLYIGTHSFIYDAISQAWSHLPATRMSASVWRKSPNAAGVGVMLDNLGFFFNNWTGYENGIESGTVSGNPTASTSNTLTCSTCSFNTTGSGLTGLWIMIDNDYNEYHQIASNTATTITITDTWTSNPIMTDDFYVAYIVPNWRTKQYSFTKPPDESHVTILFINHNKSESAQELEVYSFMEKNDGGITAVPVDLAAKFIHSINTRMRSSWVQWEFRSFVYNISNTIDAPIDIISYAFEVDAEKAVS